MIIGIAGKAATGKTTAARHVAPLLDRPTHIVPMAMVLRDEVEAFLREIGAVDAVPLVYGDQEDKVRVFYVDTARAITACRHWTDFVAANEEIQNDSGRTAVTVRRILQWWGTEYRRTQDPDYWTKAWARKVGSLALDLCHVLVDDVRFMNELAAIRGLGGRIVKIERPGFNGANDHASETSLDGYEDWDAVIVNDATLEAFKAVAAGRLTALAQPENPTAFCSTQGG